MKPFIIILILSIFLLSGCLEQQPITGSAIAETQEKIICNQPYIRHAETCCLDKNSNNICDNDEAEEEKIPEPQSSTTIQDYCSPTTYFECWGSYITKDEIFLKLRAMSKRGDGTSVIKKIKFPSIGCEKKFEPIPKDQGLKMGEILEVKIPCKISTTYFKDLPYEIEFVFYAVSDTTEWLNIEKGIITNSGTISGTVRNQPPEII